jgi:hypothetical protein
MSRKPTDTVQAGLRIRESLRRQLEKESEKHRVSINKEMAMRLEDSFKADAVKSIEIIATDLKSIHDRISAAHTETSLLGDLVRATEVLLRQVDVVDSKPIRAAAEKIRGVIKSIEIEAAQALRRAHTTGEGEK